MSDKQFVKSPVIISEVSPKFKDMPYTDLNELFHNSDSAEVSKKTLFKTRFFVVKVDPSDTREIVKSFDKKTTKATSLKGKTAAAATNMIYWAQLLVKDQSTINTNNFYKVLLYTQDGHAANFFNGIAPKNLHTDAAAKKKVDGYVNLLTKFNVFVDAVLERRNGFYFIHDSKITYDV
jgi:hypothetical protein